MFIEIFISIIMILIFFIIYHYISYYFYPKCPKCTECPKCQDCPTKKDFDDRIVNIKQKVYKSILKKTKKALDRLKIPFFLSSGTCLGYFREGKFIDYDYDIDIGIFAKHYTKKIIDEMEKEELHLYRTLGNKDTGMELSFRLPGTSLGKYAKIDIFLHYPSEDGISWYSYAAPKFKKKIHYRVDRFRLKEVRFKCWIQKKKKSQK